MGPTASHAMKINPLPRSIRYRLVRLGALLSTAILLVIPAYLYSINRMHEMQPFFDRVEWAPQPVQVSQLSRNAENILGIVGIPPTALAATGFDKQGASRLAELLGGIQEVAEAAAKTANSLAQLEYRASEGYLSENKLIGGFDATSARKSQSLIRQKYEGLPKQAAQSQRELRDAVQACLVASQSGISPDNIWSTSQNIARRVPDALKCLELTDAQWRTLEDIAFRVENKPHAVTPGERVYWDELMARPDVVRARECLTQLPEIEAILKEPFEE